MAGIAAFPRPLAFVLSGGGAIGSAQVGHLLVLRELGIIPDVIVGTSVGAINGAVVAADPNEGARQLFDIWASVRREDVFPVPPWHLLSSLRRGFTGILQVGGGLFPPRSVGGLTLMDGGLVANVPVDYALDLGVRSAIVMDAAWPCIVTRPPQTVIESIAVALRLLTRSQADAHMLAASQRGLVVHLPTPCTVRASPLDFSGVVEVIEATVELTQEFFDDRAGLPWPELGAIGRPHRHPVPRTYEVSA
ncbi:MAG: patatin-like phospholipase family protein [Propionicimonas sp.]